MAESFVHATAREARLERRKAVAPAGFQGVGEAGFHKRMAQVFASYADSRKVAAVSVPTAELDADPRVSREGPHKVPRFLAVSLAELGAIHVGKSELPTAAASVDGHERVAVDDRDEPHRTRAASVGKSSAQREKPEDPKPPVGRGKR